MSGLGPVDVDSTPDSQGPALLAVSVTTTVVALSTCVVRYCVKTRIDRSVAWDDYSIGLAMLLGMVGPIFTIVESAGQGQHEVALQFDYLAQPWLSTASTLSRASICLFVLRLVSRGKAWRVVLSTQIILLLSVNLAYIFTTLLQCRPLERLWKPSVPGECWGLSIRQNIGYFQGAFAAFSQLFVALFPIMIIQDLGIPRRLQWPFYVLFTMSIAIAMLAVLRAYVISLIYSNDQYEYQLIATILAVSEQNLGILAANILPIASLCSRKTRPIGHALSEVASARDIDAMSILSRVSRRQSNGSGFHVDNPPRAPGDERLACELHSINGWPMGIIKTVSFEVVEEKATDFEREMDIAKSRSDSAQDWDRYTP
ncbi:hypothetical protein F4779DRAFT_623800 [Xylariaceae sp. FL0662B]|nr:hypothetical protein F4779DRAFT_623800 [Xylariaceae sp. FL0662B]